MAKTIGAPTPREAVLKMMEYHPPLGKRDGLRLDFNENTAECSPRVIEALRKITAADLTRYPEREPLETMVAQHLHLDPAQVLLTNGVDEGIHVLCQTYAEAGDEILFPVPTYSMYEVHAGSVGAHMTMVPAEKDFGFPFDGLMNAISPATKLIFIANPNSPTGSTAAREQLLQIVDRAPHAMVLVDEAYFHFFGESVIDQVGLVPNLLVTRTFSKAYGLAGVRLGMIAGAAESVQWLRRVISPYSVNSLALACLAPAIEDDAYMQWYVREVIAARAEFAAALARLGVPHWPSEGNFILASIGPRHRQFVDAMHSRRVLVRDRSADPGCEGCVRITIGTRAQLAAAIAALEESLSEIGWKQDG